MDLNHQPPHRVEYRTSYNKPAMNKIRECIEINKNRSVYWPMIRDHVIAAGFAEEDVRANLSILLQRGEVRQREDEVEHDWEYTKGRFW